MMIVRFEQKVLASWRSLTSSLDGFGKGEVVWTDTAEPLRPGRDRQHRIHLSP